MRDLREDALALAALGWAIVPLHTPDGSACDCRRPQCASNGKHPRIENWPKQATSDGFKINEWWTLWPHANIGVATGAASGLVVIDIDPRHGGDVELQKLVAQHELLPWGPAVETGSGGAHYYFKYPGQHIGNRAGLKSGIDVRGEGGQVVAPPSVYRTGVSYMWHDRCDPTRFSVPVPDLPDWLLDLLVAGPDGEYHTAPPVPDTIPEGQRRERLLSLAGTMRHRGMGQGAIYAALMAENAEKCRPPLERTEIAELAADAVRRWEPGEAILVIDQGAKDASPKSRTLPLTTRLSDLQQEILPTPKMAVEGLMPVGLALLAGGLKKGKSWLMLGTGIAIAEGGLALGTIPVEDGDVLYIAYEDHKRRLQNRCKTLLGDAPWPERMEVAPTGCWPGRDEGGLEAIDSWLGAHPHARIVVVDTLQRFRGGGAGDSDKAAYAADYQVSAELQELAMKHEVVIVAVHHYRKSLSETDWVDQVSGTNGIAGAADTIMGFDRMRGEQVAILKVTGRDIDEDAFALAFDPNRYGWVITGTAEEAELSADAQEFTRTMRKIGNGNPVHFSKVAEAIGKKRNTVYKMGERLAERGHVLSFGGGMYGPVLPVQAVHEGGISDSNEAPEPWTAPLSTLSTAPDGARTGWTGVDSPLSTQSEARNGDMDRMDRKPLFLPEEEHPCLECGEVNWIPKASGGWVCDTCKPWVTPV